MWWWIVVWLWWLLCFEWWFGFEWCLLRGLGLIESFLCFYFVFCGLIMGEELLGKLGKVGCWGYFVVDSLVSYVCVFVVFCICVLCFGGN